MNSTGITWLCDRKSLLQIFQMAIESKNATSSKKWATLVFSQNQLVTVFTEA